jgi:hypothetical protein
MLIISLNGQNIDFTPSALVQAQGGTGLGIESLSSGIYLNSSILGGLKGFLVETNIIQHVSEITISSAAVGFPLFQLGYGALAVQYNNYGRFTLRDEFGNIEGESSAYEMRLSAGYGFILNPRLTAGWVIHWIEGDLLSYRNNGMYVDGGISVSVFSGSGRLNLALRNYPIKYYRFSKSEKIVSKVYSIGLSKHLAHLPLYGHLEIQYYPDAITEPIIVGVGGEFYVSKVLLFQFGINSLRFQQQTQIISGDFFAGTSLGFSFLLSRYQLNLFMRSLGAVGWITGIGFSFR